jgi:serine/threonine-protein kinase RsbW
MPVKKISFELRKDENELEQLCSRLNAFCKTLGIDIDGKCLNQINLAMDEHFINIISYGFPPGCDDCRIKIDLSFENRELAIRIEDNGIAFNPLAAKKPDIDCTLEECKVGGLGIHIMKKVMDDISYRRQDGKNILVLKKTVTLI